MPKESHRYGIPSGSNQLKLAGIHAIGKRHFARFYKLGGRITVDNRDHLPHVVL